MATYSPLPRWPMDALIVGTWLIPGTRLLPVALAASGYVVGPALGWLLMRRTLRIVDEAFAELPDSDFPYQGDTMTESDV